MISKSSENWQALPAWLKGWFYFNLIFGPKTRATVTRLHWLCHGIGLPLLLVGWVSQPALAGGIILVLHAHLLAMLRWQGDKYAIWYDQPA